jgi:hypothetical protein
MAYARHYTDPHARTCARCEQEEKVFGAVPPCRAGQACQLPQLAPENVLIWEVYKTINRQFAYDFDVRPFEVMEAYDIPRRLHLRGLHLLNKIHDLAQENQKRGEH